MAHCDGSGRGAPLKKKVILFLEDDDLNAKSFPLCFPDADVFTISNPSEVLPFLEALQVDLYVTDSPGIDGAAEVKRRYRNLPIVVYSGKNKPEPTPEGVDRWVVKGSHKTNKDVKEDVEGVFNA